ncbi:MAG: alpha-2-macroglobulin, partial [Planctomycetaceae bacterium]|nr:alpha-2-macroglobulin [Planctomycetaceae bacterium]
MADALEHLRQNSSVWKLQTLTDLNTLPDYQTERFWDVNHVKGPVDADGNPVYYSVPESFETAKNDGERWRWCLEQVVKYDPSRLSNVLLQRANFNQSQFGEQTLQSLNFFRNRSEEPEKTTNILNLETLSDNETIAQLVTGIKRFQLPDEFNYIVLNKKVVEIGDKKVQWMAVERLATIYMNRLQFTRAAEYYRKLLTEHSNFVEHPTARWQNPLDQIVKNWGRFDTSGSKVAGLHAELRYIFRNGKKVHLTAHEINVEKLINDIKEYLKSKPDKCDWKKIQIEQIGRQLIYGDNKESIKKKYLGKEVVKWTVDLQPSEKHFDRATTISVPIQQAGAYLIRAEMEDGNAESVILWLNDTVLVQKAQNGAMLYFIADAETGQPIGGADVGFFGYKIEYKSVPAANNRRRQDTMPTWAFNEFSTQTNTDGIALFEQKKDADRFNWFVTVTAPLSENISEQKNTGQKRRLAYFGFKNIWFNRQYETEYQEVKTFVITDRPVYRPKNVVKIKAWVGTAKYDLPNTNEWAGKTISYEIYDPRGEKIKESTNIKLDEYGGMTAEHELPKDAMLGVYRININQSGIGTFRVEEYKKPEYEVTIDAPKEPVRLGDKMTATIRAKYYFGSPVTEATVKYKVLREKATVDWYPVRSWDWFYGQGYAWFSYDSPWLDGWHRWGCRKPLSFGFFRLSGIPEVVAEQEVNISADGTVDVVIDTEIAKAMFPNDDQKYSITAEVVDNSRRTIVGTGNVLVAKEPFKIYVWADRGFYVPNQKIVANFQTRRLDGKPVTGDADIKLFKISYKEPKERQGEPSGFTVQENEVHNEKITFDEDGVAQMALNAKEPGQYRISCTLNGQEGGYVFNVYSSDVSASRSSFKYNALELIPDKAESAPGDNVALRINTERENSYVLLFVKPSNGVVPKPQILRLNGKSHEISVPVELRDMPNFYVEALTVSNGEVINETKELVVPPQQKVLNVTVRPSAETYKPGEKAKAELVVTDLDGKPVVGQIVVSIYDKSVEYISGGSNVGDIKEFFWKWRRQHSPYSESNLSRYIYNMPDPDKPGMQNLGLFGQVVAQNYNIMLANDGSGGIKIESLEKNSSGRGGGFGGGLMLTDAVPMVAAKMIRTDYNNALSGEEKSLGDKTLPTVRKNFADTALWIGAKETNKNGVAQIELDMPESLTTWKINVWTMAAGTRVGYGNAEVMTRKDLILRMQTPRFLIEKDKVVLSANVHNYLKTEKEV